jgi:hypothetical protein
VAGAAATATTAARRFGGSAVTGTIRRAENRELNRVSLSRALRAGDFLGLVEDNLFKVRLTIFANVFVNGHFQSSSNILEIIPASAM